MEYDTWAANGFVANKCGKPALAYGFFISFIIFCVQVFLNLFVAVIVDAFANQAAKAELPVQSIDIEIFEDVWKQFDGEATGFVKTSEIEELIIRICNTEGQQLI